MHGYSGYIKYLMWRNEGGMVSGEEGVVSEYADLEEENSEENSLIKSALQHFKAMDDLQPPPSRKMDELNYAHSQVWCTLRSY